MRGKRKGNYLRGEKEGGLFERKKKGNYLRGKGKGIF